ncbi:amidase family protein, partial [Streptomyces calidiresistens]|uniref:amidase family protein n=1 Tax=Streptomyces calidiresistens TaxID=1485586 RepID=UPI00225DE77B
GQRQSCIRDSPLPSRPPNGEPRVTDPTSLDAGGLTAGYAAGDFTPVDVALAVLERAAAIDAIVNAFVVIDAEGALDAARESAARWAAGSPLGPLDGVPASVKDILLQRGRPTLRGSAAVEPTGPFTEDAPSVARLREAGCVLIGKTTTPEFGWKGVTDCPPHGATGNPHAPDRTAGGSSGGAAAAVAFGAGPLALGTDGGGSVRIPAAFCGIFALKPTYGRVPLYPASAFGTLAHVGPMTRTAADSATLLDVIGRPDTRDWSHLGPPPAGYRAALEPPADTTVSRPLAGLRVAALHGRMAPEAKDEVMRRFSAGEVDVLVATTVIEVGVNVPNATVMAIMDADRFGVSQLHQLRGRVGRGEHPGLCLLVTDLPAAAPARARLEAVASTRDGFELSRIDLEQRREGDVLGQAQSGGRSSLRMLAVIEDEDIIAEARREAGELVERDPELVRTPALRTALDALLDAEREEFLERG